MDEPIEVHVTGRVVPERELIEQATAAPGEVRDVTPPIGNYDPTNGHRATCDFNLYPDDRVCNLDCAEHWMRLARGE